MTADPILTISGSFVASIIAMLLTNAISAGWRSNKIVSAATSSLREIISGHVIGLHDKIDKKTDILQGRLDTGLRVIDEKIDTHSRDDVANFAALRDESSEIAIALREKVRDAEMWSRDHFLLVKHFDDKMNQVMDRLSTQDRVADARHDLVSQRLVKIEQNGHST